MPRVCAPRTSSPSRQKPPPAVCHCGAAAAARDLCPACWAKAHRDGTLPPLSGKPAEPRRRLTSEEKAAILLEVKTKRIKNIAAAYGVSIHTVHRLTQPAGGVRELREDAGSGKSGNWDRRFRARAVKFAGHGAAAIAALEMDSCRWPVGDPGKEGFHFCGAKRMAGKPYCPHHHSMAWRPRGRKDDEV